MKPESKIFGDWFDLHPFNCAVTASDTFEEHYRQCGNAPYVMDAVDRYVDSAGEMFPLGLSRHAEAGGDPETFWKSHAYGMRILRAVRFRMFYVVMTGRPAPPVAASYFLPLVEITPKEYCIWN